MLVTKPWLRTGIITSYPLLLPTLFPSCTIPNQKTHHPRTKKGGNKDNFWVGIIGESKRVDGNNR
jgi:hypothetical protein